MLQPKFKYRIQYGNRVKYANVIDFNRNSGVLTVDGIVTMIYHPEHLKITSTEELKTEPDGPQERAAVGGLAL